MRDARIGQKIMTPKKLMTSFPATAKGITNSIAALFGAALTLSFSTLPARADLVLETETAQLGKKSDQLVSTAVQFEREKDGSTTTFTLNQYEIAPSRP